MAFASLPKVLMVLCRKVEAQASQRRAFRVMRRLISEHLCMKIVCREFKSMHRCLDIRSMLRLVECSLNQPARTRRNGEEEESSSQVSWIHNSEGIMSTKVADAWSNSIIFFRLDNKLIRGCETKSIHYDDDNDALIGAHSNAPCQWQTN